MRPAERHIRADTHILNLAEARHLLNATSKDWLVAAALAQQVDCVVNYLAPALAVHRNNRSGVEEVEFNHIKAPYVENFVEHALNIVASALVVDIKAVESAPVVTYRNRFAVRKSDYPVRVVFDELRALVSAKRRKPDTCLKTFFVYSVRNVFNTVRELFRVD